MPEPLEVLAAGDQGQGAVANPIFESTDLPLGVGQGKPESARLVVIVERTAPLGDERVGGIRA